MENIQIIIDKILNTSILNTIIVIIISFFIYKTITHILIKSREKNIFKGIKSNKSQTYFKMLKSIIRYTFLIITILIVLQINGINVSSMLAGVGIASVIVGFAVQDVLKDIIKGIDIISDKYFQVGDVIRYNEIEGKVINIGIKTTKVETLKNKSIISIANRNIEQVEVVSDLIYINIPMPYEVSVETAETVVNDMISNIAENRNVNECKYKGVNNLGDSSIEYFIEISCKPDFKLQVRRDALRTILLELNRNGIEVPYKQIDVHQKN